MKRLAIFSSGLRRLKQLPVFLDAEIVPVRWQELPPVDGTVGWGRGSFSQRALKAAKSRNIPFLCLEDGFLRSIELGKHEPPLSIVVDDVGIYYDASSPSRFEQLAVLPIDEHQHLRAHTLLSTWRASRVSKYNYARELPVADLLNANLTQPYVLVADQALADASISYGLANADSFQHMLEAALRENPECTVVVKVHPEVMAGHKQGHFDLGRLSRMPRLRILGEDLHPVTLIEHAQAIYVVTSQIGFEGLLWGKRVRTFGMPFYAGWGLTEDELAAPVRRVSLTLERLIYAALIAYPRYIDPETGQRCEVERVIDWMALQRRMRERFPPSLCAFQFSSWKKPIVQAFFQGSRVRFADESPSRGVVAVWGKKLIAMNPSQKSNTKIVRIEDGFLRSVGLGADLIRPLSWVIDCRGIYYDATRPSDLEYILLNTVFDDALRQRACLLRERLVAAGLTKYNVGVSDYQPLAINQYKTRPRVILVPGQVESDASLAYGAPGLRRNLDILYTVRKSYPDAYIIYKPHPDVVAGLRKQGEDEDEAIQWCNEVVIDSTMNSLLQHVDEVHTLTSLTGFEALLRGKTVVCYGQPFYAGWGLTHDIIPIARRTRRLTLDELTAGVLILYPTYVSRSSGRFTTPERALDELLEWRASNTVNMPLLLWRKGLRHILGFLKQ